MIDRVEIYVSERNRASLLARAERYGDQPALARSETGALRRRIGLSLIELGALLNPAALSRRPA